MIKIDLFRFIPDARSFGKGDAIFREGEKGDGMYVVISGRVELRVRGRMLEDVGPGAVLGEMALIDDSPRTASAIAKRDCRLVRIDAKRFRELVQQTPGFALQIMAVMAKRLRRMNQRVSSGRAAGKKTRAAPRKPA